MLPHIRSVQPARQGHAVLQAQLAAVEIDIGVDQERLDEHTPALAEGILALDFPEGDAARIGELNVRANEGQLTDDEQAELEAYINIGDLLAYWQSKACRAVLPQA